LPPGAYSSQQVHEVKSSIEEEDFQVYQAIWLDFDKSALNLAREVHLLRLTN